MATSRSVLLRRLVEMTILLVGLLLTAPATAQPDLEDESAQNAPDAQVALDLSGTHVDPTTGQRYRPTRPGEALRQGPIAVDAWVPIAFGSTVFVVAIGTWVFWLLRRRK